MAACRLGDPLAAVAHSLRGRIRAGEGPAAAIQREHELRAEHAWTIDRILLAVGEPAPDPKTYRGVTSGGDERRLRGLPAIAKGVSGAVRGSNPTDCIDRIDRERGNGKRRA